MCVLIERQKQDFLRNGGIREQMSRARREYRGTMRSERPMSTGNTGNTERLGPYNQSSSLSPHSSHSSPIQEN
ncbi:MAG: four helix bundle suffix domain-containing protein [Muribaculaceae bacterium]|nr:four helix bundle suffix domain-containing protein [Muribaculaceae bacterium]